MTAPTELPRPPAEPARITLTRDDFAAFFATLHGGNPPFAWQQRLLDHVLAHRTWPTTVDAPTGAGKTAVIDVHVFALALVASEGGPLPPRRLSMVVPRRVLVDDQHRHATALRDALVDPDDQVLAAVRTALWQLRGGAPIKGESPLMTARLRGGLPPSRRWMDEPAAAAVLCATPDMWGSRLLFRGYGASSRSWPRAAGLLAFDSAVVVDEAHLAQQLLTTARRVGQLAGIAERDGIGAAPLQVVSTTATQPTVQDTGRVGVLDEDLDASPVLGARLCRPKPVTLVPSTDWTRTTPRTRVVADLARTVLDVLDRLPASDRPRTVGCFVNTVGRAVAVAHELRSAAATGRDLRVVMLCGQLRPYDVERLAARHPGLLDVEGTGDVDVIVSTQTLEVGVDLDLAGIVTELAGSSALVQRAGRVNRLGRRPFGPLAVIVPPGEISDGTRSGPYEHEELRFALEWIRRRAADPQGLAPWAVREDPPRPPAQRRMLLQRPEWAQAEHWARTSDALHADPDLALWLAEDLDGADLSLALVVRDQVPADDAEAAALLGVLGPQRHETFPVPYTTGRDALARAHDVATQVAGDSLRAMIVRSDEVLPLTWVRRDDHRGWRAPELRPGDTVVVDAATALFTAADGESPQVLVPAADDTTRHRAPDVLEARAALPGLDAASTPGEVVHRIEIPVDDSADADGDAPRNRAESLGRDLDDLEPAPGGRDDPERTAAERAVVTEWLALHAETPMGVAARTLLAETDGRGVDVVVQRREDERPVRVLIRDRRRAVADEDVRQEWVPSSARRPPSLEDHQRAVAERARWLAGRLALTGDLADALDVAGRHHDDGKADPRFQVRLRGSNGGAPWAKGDAPSPYAARRRERRAGLPPGWRHEQRSVSDAWPQIQSEDDPELVARLIGTTHGFGRAGFPHVAADLLGDSEADAVARELFDEGRWDELIESTHRRYGLWGCAYLEAVLRAADGRVSAEGS